MQHLQKNFENKCNSDKTYCKVKDYCHYTGKYRGAAHTMYILKYIIQKKKKKIDRFFTMGQTMIIILP